MMEQERIQVLVDKSRQEDTAAFALLVSEFQPLVLSGYCAMKTRPEIWCRRRL